MLSVRTFAFIAATRRILSLGAAAIAVFFFGLLFQRGEKLAEQGRFETVFDLLAYRPEGKGIRSAFLLPDRSKKEDPTKLAVATVAAARSIARKDLSNVKVLWVDDNPQHNEQEINDIKDRLRRIGAKFDQSTQVPDALQHLQSGRFDLVITNYGNGRCGLDGKAIAECVLEGVEKLSPPRPPVIIYSSTDVQPEMADKMKCKGAVADVGNPDVLFAWIVLALDAGSDFKPSPEIQRFCMEQGERLKPLGQVSWSSAQRRQFWVEFDCNADLMTVIDFGPDRIRVAPPTIDAWRALATVIQAHGYQIRVDDTDSYNCRNIRNGVGKNLHSYGIALDVNWDTNPYKETPDERSVRYSDKSTQAERAQDVRLGIADTDMTPAMIADVDKIATKNGRRVFQWGGHWTDRKTAMHFEIALSPQELAAGIDPGTIAKIR